MIRRLIRWIVLAAAGVFAAKRLRRPKPERAATVETRPPLDREQSVWTPRLKRWAKELGVLLAVLAVGGFLLAASGLIPIKASSGHCAVTEWFLNWSMARSVSTYSAGISPPPLDSLDSPALVLKGAGHYETGCRPCHGSPSLPRPRIAVEMTAEPPYLGPKIDLWEADELFYIVKHGVKFTGMPAWPARHRDDEVWAMVAFLRALPGLDAAGYRQLVHGNTTPLDADAPMHDLIEPEAALLAIAESCGRCHGSDGNGRGLGAFPRLAGQRPSYLYAALRAYAQGTRPSGIMAPVAAGLSPEEMRALARYYSRRQPTPPSTAPVDAEALALGRAIVYEGLPGEGVPSCVDCHGPGSAPRNPFYPSLAGQYADYLLLQLQLFKQGHRGGSAYAPLMHPTADRLTHEQRQAVALFYASLGAENE